VVNSYKVNAYAVTAGREDRDWGLGIGDQGLGTKTLRIDN